MGEYRMEVVTASNGGKISRSIITTAVTALLLLLGAFVILGGSQMPNSNTDITTDVTTKLGAVSETVMQNLNKIVGNDDGQLVLRSTSHNFEATCEDIDYKSSSSGGVTVTATC